MPKLNASHFRLTTLESKTQKRFEVILQYIIFCYQKMLIDKQQYDKKDSYNEKQNRYNLEEFLTEMLVVDYLGLSSNKIHFYQNLSNFLDKRMSFHCEAKQTYIESGIRKEDYLDIKICDTILQDEWSHKTEHQVHFAVECKILENGYRKYVKDIEKLSSRPYTTIRLPFEGQIGYILNPAYTHQSAKEGINKNLKKQTHIQTTQELKEITLTSSFEASYQSKHKKNYDNSDFTIYHLFLNYNEIVVS